MTELEKLEQRILEESRRFPEVSFAKLSRIAKHFYDFGKQERFVEPQGLEEAAEEYAISAMDSSPRDWITRDIVESFKAGAKWMAEQGKTIEAVI